MSAITTSVVLDRGPFAGPFTLPFPSPAPSLRSINSLLRVTSSPCLTLLIKPVEAVTHMLFTINGLLQFLVWLVQLLVLHPFFAIYRSVQGDRIGNQIFWEYASVTFSFATSLATYNAAGHHRLILERVMPIEYWALLMFVVGLIQFLTISLGSNRARAVACVLCLLVWGPLFMVYMRRIGLLGPVPGYLVFAFGNYLHIFNLLHHHHPPTNPTDPSDPIDPLSPKEPPAWIQPTPTR